MVSGHINIGTRTIQFLAELFSRSKALRNVAKASIALGAFLFALVLWHGLTSSFIVSGGCTGYVTSNGVSVYTNCNYIYDYSPLYLPALLGSVLFSFGTLTAFVILPRTMSDLPEGDQAQSRPARLNVRSLFYIGVPFATVLFLLGLAVLQAWSGFPVAYAGGCPIVLALGNPLGICFSLFWEGFWIDALFYAAIGYGIILFLVPKIRPAHSPFPQLEDHPSPPRT